MIPLFCIAFILLFAIYAQACLPAAAFAVQQFLYTVLPSIFPFYVASAVLMRTDFCKKLGKVCEPIMGPLFGISGKGAFALIIGLVSGYPAGAKVTADLYQANEISRQDAVRLAAFTNNTGPLFLIGAVGAGMLNSARLGVLIWICHIAAALLTGMIMRYPRAPRTAPAAEQKTLPGKRQRQKQSLSQVGRLLAEAITASIHTMLPIAGAIIFFAAFTAVLKQSGCIPLVSSLLAPVCPEGLSQGILSGFLEITGGIQSISAVPISLTEKCAWIAFISGWAGISVHIQVIGILSAARVSCRRYILGKAVQALIAALLTAAAVMLIY